MQKIWKIKKHISSLLLVVLFSLSLSSVAQASEIMPLWDNTKTVQTVLSFSDGQAVCSLYISGKSGTSRITGTLTLHDETANTSDSWTFDTKKSIYSTTKYVDATSGHTYNLSFSGYVYNSSGVGEHVTGSVTKTY